MIVHLHNLSASHPQKLLITSLHGSWKHTIAAVGDRINCGHSKLLNIVDGEAGIQQFGFSCELSREWWGRDLLSR